MESPGTPRYSIESTLQGSRTRIRMGRAWFPLLFLTAWLGGWAVGEVMVIGVLTGLGPFAQGEAPLPLPVKAFLGFWLVGWTVGGFFALRQWVQFWAGEETLDIEHGRLRISRGAWKLMRSREYDLNLVKNLRVQDLGPMGPLLQRFGSLPIDTLKFDYGSKTVGFAPSLSEAEANGLLQALQSRHSQLRGPL